MIPAPVITSEDGKLLLTYLADTSPDGEKKFEIQNLVGNKIDIDYLIKNNNTLEVVDLKRQFPCRDIDNFRKLFLSVSELYYFLYLTPKKSFIGNDFMLILRRDRECMLPEEYTNQEMLDNINKENCVYSLLFGAI